MGNFLEMNCCFCSKPLEQADNITIDKCGNIIAACDDCYSLMQEFQKGGHL